MVLWGSCNWGNPSARSGSWPTSPSKLKVTTNFMFPSSVSPLANFIWFWFSFLVHWPSCYFLEASTSLSLMDPMLHKLWFEDSLLSAPLLTSSPINLASNNSCHHGSKLCNSSIISTATPCCSLAAHCSALPLGRPGVELGLSWVS